MLGGPSPISSSPWPGPESAIQMYCATKPSSLLIEHDGFIHFDQRPLDHRLRQSVPLQYLIIERHQHFELGERCLSRLRRINLEAFDRAQNGNRRRDCAIAIEERRVARSPPSPNAAGFAWR